MNSQINKSVDDSAIAFKYKTLFEQLQTIEPTIESIKKIIENAYRQYGEIEESLRPVIEQYQLAAHNLSEVLPLIIKFRQKWVEQNAVIFDRFTKFWQTFQKQYRISEQEAIPILRKYQWLITPSLPLGFVFEAVKIGRRRGNQRGALNSLFLDYFSADNFKNLENLVNGWETDTIFAPRMKIFRDCVFAMRNAKDRYNPSNIVIPTLVAQIDGIRIEFMIRNGLDFWAKDTVWKPVFKNETSNLELLDLANDTFLKILFQKSLPGKPLENLFYFNRHKILHGEYLEYGRNEDTIRAFLILDFLAAIIKSPAEPKEPVAQR